MGEKIRVMVTAVGGGGHGEQVLKALLLGADQRFEVVAADCDPKAPQLSLTSQSVVLPMASSPDYLDELLRNCRELGVKAIIHGCEPELMVFSRNRERLHEAGIFLPINPAEVIEICMDKRKTMDFLEEAGFSPPRTIACNSSEDLAAVDFYPVVLKPATGSGGSANCFIAQDSEELMALATYLHLDETEQAFIVQQYCGSPDSEYTVGVLTAMNGEVINSIAVKRNLAGSLGTRLAMKNRSGNPLFGDRLVISSGISQGQLGRFPEVTEVCEKIAVAIGATGPVNIQCRTENGEVKVFEINPRFSGTTSLRAMAGYNEPLVLLRAHFFGEQAEEKFEYESPYIARSLVETELK